MKNKLSPWQIAAISVAGVAVIGGSAAGIGYGINKSIEKSVDEKVNAALDDMYTQGTEPFEEDAVPAETSEPSESAQAEQEEQEEKEPAEKESAEKKPEPETVIVYVEPSTEAPITWEYDAKLSEEVSKLMGQKSPDGIFDPTCYTGKSHPENFIHGNTVNALNDTDWFVGDPGSVSAESIARAWTSFEPIKGNFFIEVYRYSNGWIYAIVR